jgi:hypothetical protein
MAPARTPATLLLLAVVLSGCSSGHAHVSATSSASSRASSASATTTPSATPSPSVGPIATSAVPSRSVTPSASSSATPSRSVTPSASPATPVGTSTPAAALGKDPAVKVMRAWFSAVGKAVNAGKYDTPQLDALMTTEFRTRLKSMLASDIGLHYPGPVPSKVLSVSDADGLRYIETCDVLEGWAQDPKTHKPAQPFVEAAGEVRVENVNGSWLMYDWVTAPDHHNCAGVKVPTTKW